MADAAFLTDHGIDYIVTLVDTTDEIKYVAWGTGATGAAVDDDAMETAAAPTNATAGTGTLAKTTTNTADDTIVVTHTITAAGALAITEVGVFNQATLSGAICPFHGTFSAINVSENDSIAFTLNIVINQAA
jgi:hypothetical protein